MPSEIIIDWPDGAKRYPMPESYTYREMSRIKALTGIRGGEIGEALVAGDTDAIIAIAVVASERVHDPINVDKLEDLPFGSIRLEAEEEDPTQAAPAVAESGGEVEETPATPEAGGTQD